MRNSVDGRMQKHESAGNTAHHTAHAVASDGMLAQIVAHTAQRVILGHQPQLRARARICSMNDDGLCKLMQTTEIVTA